MNGLRAAVVVLALGLITSPGPARAGIIAYDNAAVAANQGFGHALGLDFNVNKAIVVTALGVFDSGDPANLIGTEGNGVTVAIFDRTTGLQVGSGFGFSPGTPGIQINGDAFQNLTTQSFILPAGFQGSIVAFKDINYNSGGAANPTSTENDGGGAISFVGGGRYGFDSFSYPTIVDGGPTNRYDAGTFQFNVVPEPGTLTLAGMGILGLAGYGWRRRKKAV
jgi:LPXTG-motif cell wall-anchored protein